MTLFFVLIYKMKTFLLVKEPFSDPSFSRLSIIVVFCVPVPTGPPYMM